MNDTNAERGAETSAPGRDRRREPAERDAFAVIEALNAENSQLKDSVLRTLAEMENLRRRTEREVADAKTYGVTSFARDMLSVVDNLARALEHVPAEARASGRPAHPVDDRRGRTDRARPRSRARAPRRQEARAEGRRSSTRISIRRCSRRRTRPCRPERSPRSSRAAGRSATACCVRRMVGVSKGGPKAAPKGEPAIGGK